MKRIQNKSMKVDSSIHKMIVEYQNAGLIESSLIEFTNGALKSALNEIRKNNFDEKLMDKLTEIIKILPPMKKKL